MKNKLLVVGLFLFAFVFPLRAGFILSFDENGNGSINNNDTGFQTLNGSLITDPSSTLGMVLAWDLSPFGPVTEGDAFIADVSGGLSDLLRFTDANGGLTGLGNIMIFYSGDKNGGLLADTGLPNNTAVKSIICATEDATGHFNCGGTYIGFSAAVPEPSTAAFYWIGLAWLGTMVSVLTRHAGSISRRRSRHYSPPKPHASPIRDA